jgi:hypothetical protein
VSSNRLASPLGLAGLLVVGVCAFLVAEFVILDEDDAPAEAESYNDCEVVVDNTSVHDLLLTSRNPDDDDRWGSGSPPQTIAANSEATVDFKFLSDSAHKDASLQYTGRNTNIQIEMSWECEDTFSSGLREMQGNCSTNAEGWVDCDDPVKRPKSNKYEFDVYDGS